MTDTVEIPVERLAFWQAQMAHAAARAKNNPEYDGDMVHKAHREMKEVLEGNHEDTEKELVVGEVVSAQSVENQENEFRRAALNGLSFRDLEGGEYKLVKVSDSSESEE